MRLTPEFEKYLNSLTAKRVSGDGFEIRIISPWAVKYVERDRTLTLGTEVNLRDSAEGKRIWFLKVFVDEPLARDNAGNGEHIEPALAAAIMARVEDALRSNGERYEIEHQRVEDS